jgi:glycine hydroxymethyltransferase
MHETWNHLSSTSRQYLERIEQRVDGSNPSHLADRIAQLVAEHEQMRRHGCLNLNAAESAISYGARRLLDSDLATRVSEGPPGDRSFPLGAQNKYADELEGLIIAQARRLFRAEFVEWRATSTTMANTVVLVALTRPGDVLLVQSMDGGANMGYHPGAIPDLRGLRVRDMPVAGDYFEVDVEGVRRAAHECRPAMLVVGGSYTLFPYPVRELRAIADEVGAVLLYDAAHLALLIAAGLFQDPLGEGAHVMTMSTHKIMGGPVGGLVVTNDPALAERLWQVPFPPLMQTRDQNKYAATAFALTEMTAFGPDYARQTVSNARALARALCDAGFSVLAAERDFTMTHQIFMDATVLGARTVEALCRDCNLFFQASHMRGDAERGVRTGLRLSVQEITRQGMREDEMRRVASLIRRAALDREPAAQVARDVAALATRYSAPRYTFDRGGAGEGQG